MTSWKDKLFLIAVIVLVALIGFGLGRLSSKYQTAELNINSTIANTTDLDKIVSGAASKIVEKVNESNKSNTTDTTNTATAAVATVASDAIKIIGNKNSKIYHREDCPGALKMSESNKVFFNSVEEAKGAGYRPAGNCPGLE